MYENETLVIEILEIIPLRVSSRPGEGESFEMCILFFAYWWIYGDRGFEPFLCAKLYSRPASGNDFQDCWWNRPQGLENHRIWRTDTRKFLIFPAKPRFSYGSGKFIYGYYLVHKSRKRNGRHCFQREHWVMNWCGSSGHHPLFSVILLIISLTLCRDEWWNLKSAYTHPSLR